MTESEKLISFLERMKNLVTARILEEQELEMITKALEEVEQYRAIGTAEELKAIKQWKSDIIESFSKYDVNSVDELMQKFKALTEKAEPKKPSDISKVRDCDGYIGLIGKCSSCGAIIDEDTVYCDCGQRLDWE